MVGKDGDVDQLHGQYKQMMDDLISLGGGLEQSLKRTKESFLTNQRFARVIDRIYNGTYNREFVMQAAGQAELSQYDNARRYSAIWDEVHNKHRASAA